MEKYFKLMGAMIFGCLLGLLISYWDVVESNSDPRLNKTKIGESYSTAIEKASPAVVNIYSEQIFKNNKKSPPRLNPIFGSSDQIRTSLGSGVILSSDGYILTNQHVVGKQSIRVIAELTDGRKFIARLVGIDEGTDLAVLKIDDPKANFPSMELEDSDKVNVVSLIIDSIV